MGRRMVQETKWTRKSIRCTGFRVSVKASFGSGNGDAEIEMEMEIRTEH